MPQRSSQGLRDDQDIGRIQKVLEGVAALLGKLEEPISSFGSLKSGLIESLYLFSTGDDYGLEVKTGRKMLMDAFMASNPSETIRVLIPSPGKSWPT
ncbi:Ubiquitin fusion degradation protein 4 [Tilletia horrida]|uniref:Ubiquitin fusion degradation protein 4 n=1 Tax=Tilletia horrida TaxID=155126 RepID=A0AAN6GTP1_9BASI|nr:Ubiquitin fusion degradation protein 4 [Tilletia horrida]KAK0555977.1 Ubiquitin fusion degradation protein 4 [Tilletia horrida]KAK0568865.1 Ubiquitin fusion degradation protein 4 [Tilletia horrida]